VTERPGGRWVTLLVSSLLLGCLVGLLLGGARRSPAFVASTPAAAIQSRSIRQVRTPRERFGFVHDRFRWNRSGVVVRDRPRFVLARGRVHRVFCV
jgi:hypothetical protein